MIKFHSWMSYITYCTYFVVDGGLLPLTAVYKLANRVAPQYRSQYFSLMALVKVSHLSIPREAMYSAVKTNVTFMYRGCTHMKNFVLMLSSKLCHLIARNPLPGPIRLLVLTMNEILE